MENEVRAMFARYETSFNDALQERGEPDVRFYASAFIAAGPSGVRCGANDETLMKAMADGYAHYRSTGTKNMRIEAVDLHPIHDLHGLARVSWLATYARKDGTETDIAFEVHYFVQMQDGTPKIFGWVSGDEEALLKKHGIVD